MSVQMFNKNLVPTTNYTQIDCNRHDKYRFIVSPSYLHG